MGRKKIRIARLEDDRNRHVTFHKRKAGLMKKAMELSILCDCEVALFIFAEPQIGTIHEFSSSDPGSVLQKYFSRAQEEHECFDNSDYGLLANRTARKKGGRKEGEGVEAERTGRIIGPMRRRNFNFVAVPRPMASTYFSQPSPPSSSLGGTRSAFTQQQVALQSQVFPEVSAPYVGHSEVLNASSFTGGGMRLQGGYSVVEPAHARVEELGDGEGEMSGQAVEITGIKRPAESTGHVPPPKRRRDMSLNMPPRSVPPVVQGIPSPRTAMGLPHMRGSLAPMVGAGQVRDTVPMPTSTVTTSGRIPLTPGGTRVADDPGGVGGVGGVGGGGLDTPTNPLFTPMANVYMSFPSKTSPSPLVGMGGPEWGESPRM